MIKIPEKISFDWNVLEVLQMPALGLQPLAAMPHSGYGPL